MEKGTTDGQNHVLGQELLLEAEGSMHITSIHEALEERLRGPVSRASLKDCLSDHSHRDDPRFRRQKRGWDRLR
jgi:hypothetical protein